jgi:hypothetical protein
MTTATSTREPVTGDVWSDKDKRVGKGRSGDRRVKVLSITLAEMHGRTVRIDYVNVQTLGADGAPKGAVQHVKKHRFVERFVFVQSAV